ncbi:MAG TPA: ATP-binding cassette domain-containing protein [Candidatus Xenobia bacterium]|nr:ATP-binding cassette domain-containing protein [Candidatus Xenobia bacterium]
MDQRRDGVVMSGVAVQEEVIRLENVALGFGAHQVLRDVSFVVRRGETRVLIGATGTGKTLILKLILGLLKPDRGRIHVLGRDITNLEEEELFPLRAHLGIVFQEMALFDSLPVRENVAYRLIEETVHGKANLSDEEIEKRVRTVLSFVDLEEAIEKMPAELSGGMRRRVALARALITEPPVILYDSPTAGLDPVTAQTILTLIAKLRDTRQTSSLVVTHRLQDAFILSSSVYDEKSATLRPAASDGGRSSAPPTSFLLLRDGVIYFDGTPEELLAARDPYVQSFLAWVKPGQLPTAAPPLSR